MTNEFAIKVLTELRGYGDKFANIGYDRKEALDMAIKALEKDIPKCVKVEKWINTYCPNGCGQVLSIHHGDGYYSIQHEPDRCPNCGQVLEWEDAE